MAPCACGLACMSHELLLLMAAIIIPWRMTISKRWGIYHYFLSKSFFTALNQRGVSAVVFGGIEDFNNLEAYRRCKEAGANAICTDKPTMLQAFLSEEGPLVSLPSICQ